MRQIGGVIGGKQMRNVGINNVGERGHGSRRGQRRSHWILSIFSFKKLAIFCSEREVRIGDTEDLRRESEVTNNQLRLYGRE